MFKKLFPDLQMKMKTIFFVLFLLASCESPHGQTASTNSDLCTFHLVYNSHTEFSRNDTNYKSPVIAFLMSFIGPELAFGQLYNDQYLNFGIRVGITFASVIWMIADPWSIGHSKGGGSGIIGLALIALNWVSSFIEAPISSLAINRDIDRKKTERNSGIDFNHKANTYDFVNMRLGF